MAIEITSVEEKRRRPKLLRAKNAKESLKRRARKRRITVVALYWHFVDVVWVFLFIVVYLI